MAGEHRAGQRRAAACAFLDRSTDSELAACYAAAEVFALPSRGEGFGLVYLEAMARGKPVIGGAHGGAPEVIQDGVTGYVVQHGDTLQLVRRSTRCFRIRNWRRKWERAGENGLRRNSGLTCSPKDSGRFCANYANPERHTDLRAFFEFGGPPVKVKALAEGMARKGHEVTVLTADWGAGCAFARCAERNRGRRQAHLDDAER